MRLPGSGAVTGWAALRLAGGGFFDGLAPDGREELPVPLVLHPGTDLRRGPGYRVRRERLPRDEVQVRFGIPCTTPARALFDEMRVQPDLREAVVVLDMVLAARLVSTGDFDRFLENHRGWSGVRRAQRARRLADAGSRSPQESRMRLIWVLDACYPAPLCNRDVADQYGRFIGRPISCARSSLWSASTTVRCTDLEVGTRSTYAGRICSGWLAWRSSPWLAAISATYPWLSNGCMRRWSGQRNRRVRGSG